MYIQVVILFRDYVNLGIENHCWGVLCPVGTKESVCIASRKQFGLFDIRSKRYDTLQSFGERLYVRDMTSMGNYVYVTTDDELEVYDLRNFQKKACWEMGFEHTKIVQNIDVKRIDNKSWVFVSSRQGDIR